MVISKVQFRWAILAAILFISLFIGVSFQLSYISWIDSSVINGIIPIRSQFLNNFFILLTNSLNPLPTLGWALIISIFLQLWQRNIYITLFFLINSTIVTGGVNTLVKHIVNRPRPAVHHLVTATSSSFPSGHSMTAMLLGGSLIVILNLLIQNKPLNYFLVTIISVWIFLIGFSRIYVHVHYPTDVLAGWCLGFVCLTISEEIFLRLIHLDSKKRLND